MCVRVLQIHIYVKLPVFIHLPLTLTKLCHFKCKHLVNFYISSEKNNSQKNRDISSTVWHLDEIWHTDAKWIVQVHWRLKIVSLKIQDGR